MNQFSVVLSSFHTVMEDYIAVYIKQKKECLVLVKIETYGVERAKKNEEIGMELDVKQTCTVLHLELL